MIEVTENPIDVQKVLESVQTERAGALVHFIGTVRKERGIAGLFYECYPQMAFRILAEIVEAARKRGPVERISLVHRYGRVEVGEPSVAIAVASAHREEAFEACRFVIERIKETAPFWKKEFHDVENL